MPARKTKPVSLPPALAIQRALRATGSDGPTHERLRHAGALVEIQRAEHDIDKRAFATRVRVHDGTWERLSRKLHPALVSAGNQFIADRHAAYGSDIRAIDYSRVQVGKAVDIGEWDDTPSGRAKRRWDKAYRALEREQAIVVCEVLIRGATLYDAGRAVAASKALRIVEAIASEDMRRGLEKLSRHYGMR